MSENISKGEIVSRLDEIRHESENQDVLHKLHKLRRAVAEDVEEVDENGD